MSLEQDTSKLIQSLVDSAEARGVILERNRILSVLIRFKEAGWLDSALAHLLAEEIVDEVV